MVLVRVRVRVERLAATPALMPAVPAAAAAIELHIQSGAAAVCEGVHSRDRRAGIRGAFESNQQTIIIFPVVEAAPLTVPPLSAAAAMVATVAVVMAAKGNVRTATRTSRAGSRHSRRIRLIAASRNGAAPSLSQGRVCSPNTQSRARVAGVGNGVDRWALRCLSIRTAPSRCWTTMLTSQSSSTAIRRLRHPKRHPSPTCAVTYRPAGRAAVRA